MRSSDSWYQRDGLFKLGASEGLVVDCIATVAFVQFWDSSRDSSVDARSFNVSLAKVTGYETHTILKLRRSVALKGEFSSVDINPIAYDDRYTVAVSSTPDLRMQHLQAW